MGNGTTTRRNFLKVGAACGAGVLGASLLGGCAAGEGSPAGTSAATLEEVSWDGEFDVVVVGFGAAGASAAIAAAESGARVLVADKAPEGSEGGNSRYSSQLFASAESEEDALSYVRALAGGYAVPDDVLAAYAAGLSSVRGQMADWGLDEGELLDVTDVTPDDIAALAEGR